MGSGMGYTQITTTGQCQARLYPADNTGVADMAAFIDQLNKDGITYVVVATPYGDTGTPTQIIYYMGTPA